MRARRSEGAPPSSRIVAAALAVVALVPATARAEDSPQTMAFEIKFGAYRPAIDSEFSNDSAKPYAEIFDDESFLMSRFEFDWQILRAAGSSLGVGFGAGYGSVTGKGLLSDWSESADDTEFSMVPMDLSAVYRFDLLARHAGVPFVPVFKGGVDYVIWWITDGLGDVSDYKDDKGVLSDGSGGTFGWHASAGLCFLLDFLEEDAAKIFDVEFGVNNSYLFAEYVYSQIDDFGSDKSFFLGDQTVYFGLAFEY
jgi:hypothetical protein